MGRGTSSPPQFGQTLPSRSWAQALQNVHSNVQIRAFFESFGRSQLQHSQLGRSSSIWGHPVNCGPKGPGNFRFYAKDVLKHGQLAELHHYMILGFLKLICI